MRSFSSRISCARFAIASLARSSLDKNLGCEAMVNGNYLMTLRKYKIPWQQLPSLLFAFVKDFLWKVVLNVGHSL